MVALLLQINHNTPTLNRRLLKINSPNASTIAGRYSFITIKTRHVQHTYGTLVSGEVRNIRYRPKDFPSGLSFAS